MGVPVFPERRLMFRPLFVAAAMAAAFSTMAGAQNTIVGTWEMTSVSLMGEMKSRLVFTDEGGELAGRLQNQFLGLQEFSSVSLKDDYVVMQLDLDVPAGPLTLIYSGTLVGDTITGNEIKALPEPRTGATSQEIPVPGPAPGSGPVPLPGDEPGTKEADDSWFRAIRIVTTDEIDKI